MTKSCTLKFEEPFREKKRRPAFRLRVRRAKSTDRKEIARLCRRSVGREDYVLDFLDGAIEDGGLFLAFDQSQLVAMAHFERCIDGSGWLNMARTDPDWRGLGVAGFLQGQIAFYARRKGIRTLRLWTLSTNKAAIRACVKGGFRPVCETVHVSSNLRKTGKRWKQHPANVFASNRLPKSIWSSEYLSKMHGYLGYRWHIVKGTAKLLRRIARKRELYWLGDTLFLLRKRGEWKGNVLGSFSLLNGSVARSLIAAKQVAQSEGFDNIGGFVPFDRNLLRSARRQGLRVDPWAKHCMVFEKKI